MMKKQKKKLNKTIEEIYFKQINSIDEEKNNELIISIEGLKENEEITEFPLIKYIIN